MKPNGLFTMNRKYLRQTEKRWPIGVASAGLLWAVMSLLPAFGQETDRYGSISASSEDDGGWAYGIAWSFESHDAAKEAARSECIAQGGTDCREIAWFANGCGALALTADGSFAAGGGGESIALAEQDALMRCESANGGACRVEAAQCVDPDRAAEAAERPQTRVALQPGQTFQDCSDCPEMLVVPAGSFRMGCVSGQYCFDSELPVHRVTHLQPFALSKHEITFGQFDTCVADGGCGRYSPDDRGWGRGSRPVLNVSWEEAQAYVSWLSGVTGESYRLPSESEWEYAARAGSETLYSWGNEIGSNRMNCGFIHMVTGARYGDCGDAYDYTAPVGSFPPNAFGFHDMLGNVSEWVEDCWNSSYEGAPSDGGAWLRGDCSQRVLRGGSWSRNPVFMLSRTRIRDTAGVRSSRNGFRVARKLTP